MAPLAPERSTPLSYKDEGKAKRPKPVISSAVQLSSNLDSTSALCPMGTARAQVEPHGAVALFRFTSGEHVESFERSAAEVDTLITTNRRRPLLMSRYRTSANTETEFHSA